MGAAAWAGLFNGFGEGLQAYSALKRRVGHLLFRQE